MDFAKEKAVPLLALVAVAALAFNGTVSGAEAMAFIAGLVFGAPQALQRKAA